jgi:hypothetical protein
MTFALHRSCYLRLINQRTEGRFVINHELNAMKRFMMSRAMVWAVADYRQYCSDGDHVSESELFRRLIQQGLDAARRESTANEAMIKHSSHPSDMTM